jgi:hypothetical protein
MLTELACHFQLDIHYYGGMLFFTIM